MHAWLLLVLAAEPKPVEAPVTQVTVMTDQARVVRTAKVTVGGDATVEFPPLRDTADVSSLKVEATGAEVRRVDLARLTPEQLRTEDARQVLAQIDAVDTELERLTLERAVWQQQLATLHGLSPSVPTGDPLKPAPRLNGQGWQAAAQFAPDQLEKVHQKKRAVDQAITAATRRRNQLVEQARQLGNPQVTSGWKVVAQLSGSGPATLTLTYLVRNAQWTPTWDLQLQPDSNQVQLSLAGLVSQQTGEDWSQATLLLSTAVPSHAVQVPKLASWKIGVADRFIPTPTPRTSPIAPPPPVVPLARQATEADVVRARLNRLGVSVVPVPPPEEPVLMKDAELEEDDAAFDQAFGGAVAPAPPPPPPRPAAPAAMPMAMAESMVARPTSRSRRADAPAEAVTGLSLAPPPAWRAPAYGPSSPVTLAGGYDLSFTSLQKETVPSGDGARRVPLWSAQWPVSVERKLYPALTQDAFLVAELKNPSQQVLPGGPAQLFVGADPAGSAQLELVSPGEPFTLPLGIDRALKPVRNVQLVEETRGVFSKEELGTYVVTIELANPYPAPVPVRVLDQWPVTDQKDVEVKLIESKPLASQDAKRGSLEWRLTLAPRQKQVFSFTYTVKRPRGWKLQQQEVVR